MLNRRTIHSSLELSYILAAPGEGGNVGCLRGAWVGKECGRSAGLIACSCPVKALVVFHIIAFA